ncbi:hypothetical protein F4212_02450 [Candidatus Poribacteria bacterium]|nr:hypothetical protein [Candidatus Poribacteria bacterium]
MSITGKKELEKPILEILADGKEWERMALVVELASRLSLTDAELSEGLGGRHAETISKSKLYRYANRAMEDLQVDGFIENPEHGIWRIKT